MEERTCVWRLLLFSCIWQGLSQLVQSQTPCGPSLDPTVIATNSTTPSVLLMCVVPPNMRVNNITEETWEWDKLAIDTSVDQVLADPTSTSRDSSTYQLSVNCTSGGLYEALYRDNSGSCMYKCSYFVEVEEVRVGVIRSVFNNYPEVTLPTVGNALSRENDTEPTAFVQGVNGTEVLVGSCSEVFYSGFSGCLLRVMGHWFKDRQPLNVRIDPRYQVSISGELRIMNLSESTTGDYVCVTTLPMNLGSYVTLAVGVLLVPAPTAPPSTTVTQGPSSSPSSLRDWEIGLIVANVAFVMILVLILAVGCFVLRRRRERPAKRAPTAKAKPRPESMVEHIQLLEEEVEEVDFMGPVEVPFSSILFEELLHKGTFKVVHHAVVNYPPLGIMSQPVAVKRLKDDKSELGMEELMGETYTLKAVQNKAGSHPNIVQLVGVTTQGGPTCLLLEYIPHGRLDDFLIALKDGPLPEWYVRFVKETSKGAYHKQVSGDLMRVLLQVAEGMGFLTDHGFIHRDLSTRTVLMGDRMNIKIADIGMIHEGYYYVVTEREHFLQDMAPECLWDKRFSIWSDIWSFGILAYKVITMETVPFPDATVSDLYDRMVGGERPQLLASFSNEMYFLLQRCWQFIATERPTFANIVTELKDLAEKPTKHIMLKVAKEPQTGYISDTGQVFLHPLPAYALDIPSKTTKKKWRSSGTQQSIASSVDDTVYTRETAETVLDFTQSENEYQDNYESYLRGDLPTWKQDESSSSSEDEDLNTPKLRQTKGTRVWVESAGSKVYLDTPPASDEGSKSEGVAAKKKKKKRSMKKGFVNPIAVMSTRSPEKSGAGGVGVNTNNNNNVGAGQQGEESESSINPPSITEDETNGVAKRQTRDQFSVKCRNSDPSSEEIVEL